MPVCGGVLDSSSRTSPLCQHSQRVPDSKVERSLVGGSRTNWPRLEVSGVHDFVCSRERPLSSLRMALAPTSPCRIAFRAEAREFRVRCDQVGVSSARAAHSRALASESAGRPTFVGSCWLSATTASWPWSQAHQALSTEPSAVFSSGESNAWKHSYCLYPSLFAFPVLVYSLISYWRR